MKISAPQNINFQSKKTIYFADDIARHVNKCYPRISSSLTDDFININAFRKLKRRLNYDTEYSLRYEISGSFNDADNFIGKILAFVKPVKKYKLGNCGEAAQLSAIVAKVNGLKNCYIASLKTKGGKDLDHSVLYVNGKKPYIIDAWLGFADYVPNAFQRYKNEFNHHFDILEGEKLKFIELKSDYTEVLNSDFSRSQINKIKKIFPEQFIKRGYVE